MYNLEQEMKVWEERSNDEFGTLLKSIIELTNDYFASDINEEVENKEPETNSETDSDNK